MKKEIYVLTFCALLMIMTGCGIKNRNDSLQNKEEIVQPIDLSEAKQPMQEKKIDVNVYKIDKSSGECIIEKKECSNVNGENLWELLKEEEVVPNESNIFYLKKEGTQLELDVDNVFGEYLRSFGTTGEYEIMRCIVNTYLDANEAEMIKITESGKPLCSGHTEYTDYLKKYE